MLEVERRLKELGYKEFKFSPTGGPFHGRTFQSPSGIMVELLEDSKEVHVIFADTEVIVSVESLLVNDMKVNIQINL